MIEATTPPCPWILSGYGSELVLSADALLTVQREILLDIDLFGCGLLAGFPEGESIEVTSASPVPGDSLRFTTSIEPGHEGIPEWMATLRPGEEIIGAWACCPDPELLYRARALVIPIGGVKSLRVGVVFVGPGMRDVEGWVALPSIDPLPLRFDIPRTLNHSVRQP